MEALFFLATLHMCLMDVAPIESCAFFAVRQQRPHVIYVDNIYLGR